MESVVVADREARCVLCDMVIPTGSEKAIKQHLKSRPHKLKLKGEDPLPTKAADNREDTKSTECALCNLLSVEETSYSHIPAAISESARFCRAPEWIPNPKKAHLAAHGSTPFITTVGGEIPEIPSDFSRAAELYCNAGGIRLPNIDIDGKRIAISSMSQAKRVLQEGSADTRVIWAAFAFEGVSHPRWWPDGDHVPTYDQVILGRGATDIGLHTDRYTAPGECSAIPVNTYITLARGTKYVVMLPPGEQSVFSADAPFPLHPSAELADKIAACSGFYFELRPVDRHTPVCLYIPRGWHHWLLGAGWTVAYGGSRFGARE